MVSWLVDRAEGITYLLYINKVVVSSLLLNRILLIGVFFLICNNYGGHAVLVTNKYFD